MSEPERVRDILPRVLDALAERYRAATPPAVTADADSAGDEEPATASAPRSSDGPKWGAATWGRDLFDGRARNDAAKDS